MPGGASPLAAPSNTAFQPSSSLQRPAMAQVPSPAPIGSSFGRSTSQTTGSFPGSAFPAEPLDPWDWSISTQGASRPPVHTAPSATRPAVGRFSPSRPRSTWTDNTNGEVSAGCAAEASRAQSPAPEIRATMVLTAGDPSAPDDHPWAAHSVRRPSRSVKKSVFLRRRADHGPCSRRLSRARLR